MGLIIRGKFAFQNGLTRKTALNSNPNSPRAYTAEEGGGGDLIIGKMFASENWGGLIFGEGISEFYGIVITVITLTANGRNDHVTMISRPFLFRLAFSL